jgi:charged multivesicular body protein 1
MDKFESQFTDLDVQTSYMESTMSNTTATTTPQDQVDLLMAQVADEAGLEIQQELGSTSAVPSSVVGEKKEVEPEVEDRLADR